MIFVRNKKTIDQLTTEFIYDPYPVGLIKNVFDESYYNELVDSFPPPELFKFMPTLGCKYSLSELNNPQLYHNFIRSKKIWYELHGWIKSEDFIRRVLRFLNEKNINLGIRDFGVFYAGNDITDRIQSNLRKLACSFVQKSKLIKAASSKQQIQLSARFEFSMLPANGGYIKPHTDSPSKIITLVLPIFKEKEWSSEFGGGTDVMKPKDITRNFNYMNQQLEFSEVEVIKTFDYCPNQCLIFVKTFNSLHAVRPMFGCGNNIFRKTLTINIEMGHSSLHHL